MKKLVTIGYALVFGMTAPLAHSYGSSENGYLGVSHSFLTYKDESFPEDIDVGVLIGNTGVKINNYISAEVRAGFGTYDYKIDGGDASLSIDVDHLIGGYGLIGIPLKSPIYPYIVAGMTRAKFSLGLESPSVAGSFSGSESDFSYGAGAKISMGDNFAITWEYLQYFDEDDFEIAGITLGAQVQF